MAKKSKKNRLSLDENMNVWYEKNNMVFDKNELYYTFFNTLFETIEETYLGIDVLYDEESINSHFNWCYEKTIKNTKKDDMEFKSGGPLYDYLFFFFFGSYYKMPYRKNVDNIYMFFNGIFDFDKPKNSVELDTYKFLYKLFELSLK